MHDHDPCNVDADLADTAVRAPRPRPTLRQQLRALVEPHQLPDEHRTATTIRLVRAYAAVMEDRDRLVRDHRALVVTLRAKAEGLEADLRARDITIAALRAPASPMGDGRLFVAALFALAAVVVGLSWWGMA